MAPVAAAGFVLVAATAVCSVLAGILIGAAVWALRRGLVFGGLGMALFVLTAPFTLDLSIRGAMRLGAAPMLLTFLATFLMARALRDRRAHPVWATLAGIGCGTVVGVAYLFLFGKMLPEHLTRAIVLALAADAGIVLWALWRPRRLFAGPSSRRTRVSITSIVAVVWCGWHPLCLTLPSTPCSVPMGAVVPAANPNRAALPEDVAWEVAMRVMARVWRLAAIAGCLALAGCGENETPSQLAPTDAPDQEVRGFTLTESVGSVQRWRLTARSAATYRNRGVIVAQAVAIEFYDAAGKPYSHLTADQGEIRPATNDMSARGHVTIVTTAGTRVETPSLRFLNREQKIVSDDRVTVRRGGDVLSGIGFESDPSLDHFQFHREVRAQVSSPSGRIRVRERGR